jgi:hypothetical protein
MEGRRVPPTPLHHLPHAAGKFTAPGPEAHRAVAIAKDNFLRSASLSVSRTLPKDVKPDYERWDAEIRARLQRPGTSPASLASTTAPLKSMGTVQCVCSVPYCASLSRAASKVAVRVCCVPYCASLSRAASKVVGGQCLHTLCVCVCCVCVGAACRIAPTTHRRKNGILATMFTASEASAVSSVSENG